MPAAKRSQRPKTSVPPSLRRARPANTRSSCAYAAPRRCATWPCQSPDGTWVATVDEGATAWPWRPWCFPERRAGPSVAEQPLEKVIAGLLIGLAALGGGGVAESIVAGGHGLGGQRLAGQGCDQAPVMPIDVGMELDVAVLARHGGKIGHMHGDLRRQRDLVVSPPRHQIAHLLGRPALVFAQQNLGEFAGVLHADAAV